MRYINYLDYPAIPSNLEQEILDTVQKQAIHFEANDLLVNTSKEMQDVLGITNYDSNTNIGYHYSQAKVYFPNLVNYYFLEPSDNVKDWVVKNINSLATINIQVMSNGTCIPPHVDEVRTTAINYILQTGGAVHTDFFHVKDSFNHLDVTSQTAIPHERLTLMESCILQPSRWHSLDVRQIHSVENIDPKQKRIALTLSIV